MNKVAQFSLLALLLSALGLSMDEAGKGGLFADALRTFCALLVLATLGIVIFAFTGQYHSKRLSKKASKLDALEPGASDGMTLTEMFPAQSRGSILYTHANPLHGDNHNSHPLEDGGAAARERQKPAARAVMTDRASIL